MNGRDERGRFVSGNQISKGNRGNRQPKWGNKNAKKHGLYERLTFIRVKEDSYLWITQSRVKTKVIRVSPKAYFVAENGHYYVHSSVLTEISERYGFIFDGMLSDPVWIGSEEYYL